MGRPRSRLPGVIVGLGLALGPAAAPALDLTAGSGAANDCPGARPGLSVAAVAYLEPAPVTSIGDYGGDRYAPAAGNNVAVGVGFAELAATLGAYCIGVLYRAEFEGTATRDLLDLVVANHAGRPFDVGRTYSGDYAAKALKADGVRLRRAFRLGRVRSFGVTLAVGASLLKGSQGRDETLAGVATATSASYAVGTATWVRTDSDLNLSGFNTFVGAGHATGIGYSTDIHLRAVSDGGTTLEAIVMDPVGRVYWHDIRHSLRTADNATIRYDANFNREAFVTGVDSRIASVERLTAKVRVGLEQPLRGQVGATLEDDVVDGYHFVAAGARYGTPERFAAASLDLRTRALGLTGRWRWFGASVTSNRWRLREATALGASLRFVAAW